MLDHSVDGIVGNLCFVMPLLNSLLIHSADKNFMIFTFEFCYYLGHITDLLINYFPCGVGAISPTEIWFASQVSQFFFFQNIFYLEEKLNFNFTYLTDRIFSLSGKLVWAPVFSLNIFSCWLKPPSKMFEKFKKKANQKDHESSNIFFVSYIFFFQDILNSF